MFLLFREELFAPCYFVLIQFNLLRFDLAVNVRMKGSYIVMRKALMCTMFDECKGFKEHIFKTCHSDCQSFSRNTKHV